MLEASCAPPPPVRAARWAETAEPSSIATATTNTVRIMRFMCPLTCGMVERPVFGKARYTITNKPLKCITLRLLRLPAVARRHPRPRGPRPRGPGGSPLPRGTGLFPLRAARSGCLPPGGSGRPHAAAGYRLARRRQGPRPPRPPPRTTAARGRALSPASGGGQALGLLHHLVDPADHVEGLFRQLVELACDYPLERGDRVLKLDVLPL